VPQDSAEHFIDVGHTAHARYAPLTLARLTGEFLDLAERSGRYGPVGREALAQVHDLLDQSVTAIQGKAGSIAPDPEFDAPAMRPRIGGPFRSSCVGALHDPGSASTPPAFAGASCDRIGLPPLSSWCGKPAGVQDRRRSAHSDAFIRVSNPLTGVCCEQRY